MMNLLRHLGAHADEMAIVLAVWLCSLPLVGFLFLPRFGPQGAAIAAALVLMGLTVACWGACGWRLGRGNENRSSR